MRLSILSLAWALTSVPRCTSSGSTTRTSSNIAARTPFSPPQLALQQVSIAGQSTASESVVDRRPGIIIIGPDEVPRPCPMRAMSVVGRVVDGVAEVTLHQQFETGEGGDAAAASHYQLPLDEGAAVTAFRATVGDRVVRAVVKEKGEARAEFDAAVAAGRSAYLAEQVRADIFKISVGNLPRMATVTVSLTYVVALEAMGGDTVRFVLPTAVAPRYEPLSANSTVNTGGHTEGTIGRAAGLMGRGVTLELEAVSAAPFTAISSDTHNITVADGAAAGERSVTVDSNLLARDVVILLTTALDHRPKLYVEKSGNSTAMMFSLVPRVEASVRYNSEFIFIVDRSGSMRGQKIAQTRKALERVLAALPEGSLFNIIGFGTDFKPLFRESKFSSDPGAMSDATDYVDAMGADFGGTEILKPLRHALNAVPVPTFDRQVLVLTDGQVSNTAETLRFVRKFHATARVFSLGIGDHVSRLLVQGLARAGRGTAEFVDGTTDQAVFDAVERQMEVATTGALDDLSIAWGAAGAPEEDRFDLERHQAPYAAPPLLVGKRFLLFFLIDTTDVPESAWLSAYDYAGDAAVQYALAAADTVVLPAADGPGVLHKMAARALIRDLEEGGSRLSLDRPNMNAQQVQTKIDDAVARLGVAYQIASSRTSFIAVDNHDWSEAPALGEEARGQQEMMTMTASRSFSAPISYTLTTPMTYSNTAAHGNVFTSPISTHTVMQVQAKQYTQVRVTSVPALAAAGHDPSFPSAMPSPGTRTVTRTVTLGMQKKEAPQILLPATASSIQRGGSAEMNQPGYRNNAGSNGGMFLKRIGSVSLEQIVSASADRGTPLDPSGTTGATLPPPSKDGARIRNLHVVRDGGSAEHGAEAGARPNLGGLLLHSFVSASVDRGTATGPSGTAGAAPLPRIDATVPDGARLHTPHVRGSGGVDNRKEAGAMPQQSGAVRALGVFCWPILVIQTTILLAHLIL